MSQKKLMLACGAFTTAISCIDVKHDDAGALVEAHRRLDSGIVNVQHADSSVNKCPDGMAFIEGEYCPSAQEACLRWVDPSGNTVGTPIDTTSGRCGEFVRPTRCLVEKVHKKFCIDIYEYPNVSGQRPQSWMTWHDLQTSCKSQGKRLCTKSEWTFACEGPEMRPYPYDDGYHRDRAACNFDNPSSRDLNVMKATSHETATAVKLDEMLAPSGTMPRCVSPFGVHDMVGNIDEFVVNESGSPYASGLVGGHIFGVRNACRPMTTSHNENFSWYETGGRCCH